MESFSSFYESQLPSSSSSRSSWTYDSLTNFRQLSPVVQTHLQQVYPVTKLRPHNILCNINGLLITLATLGCIYWIWITPPCEEEKRILLLMTYSLLQGASIGPLIESAIDILVSIFMGIAIVFACFSGASMLARHREYLYLGGLLSSSLSILLWFHVASSCFGGFSSLFLIELYFGLLVFVGYIVFDTQMIIDKAHLGDLDYVKHALLLFTDFIGVFVRILIIMLKSSVEEEEEEEKWVTWLWED